MADNEIPLDVRVTPSFQSANVRALPQYDTDTAPLFGPVESAFDLALQTCISIHEAREAAKHDLTLTENARLVAVADFADKVTERATRAFDYATTALTNNIAAMEQELSKPVQARAAHAISVEIRAHVKGLKTGAHVMDFVRQAIDRGDHETCGAVLSAPAYLSGMTPETQAVMLRMYHEKANPQTAKRLAAAKAAQDYLDRNAGLFMPQVEKAIGGDYRKIQMLRKGANARAKAFAEGQTFKPAGV
jgi:hypothetical protein